jgi:hypothetical protein
LPTYLCLGLSNGLLPSGFPTNILYAFLFSPPLTNTQTQVTFSSDLASQTLLTEVQRVYRK